MSLSWSSQGHILHIVVCFGDVTVQSVVLRCCVELPSTGGPDVPMGNVRVLDKLHSGISCSTVGPESNVNKSTTILNKVSLKRNT